MRVSVVGAYFWQEEDEITPNAIESARITHAHGEAIAGAIAVAHATAYSTNHYHKRWKFVWLMKNFHVGDVVKVNSFLGKTAIIVKIYDTGAELQFKDRMLSYGWDYIKPISKWQVEIIECVWIISI